LEISQEKIKYNDNIKVEKVDMRKKENKPTKEDVERMNSIMDSIVGEDG